MMKLKPAFHAALLLLTSSVGALSARAQVNFAFTARADSTAFGYNTGQSYQFVVTLTSSWSDNLYNSFTSTTNSWQEQSFVDPALFTNVSGSGVSGTFVRPSDPSSYLNTNSAGELLMNVGGSSGTTGVTTLSGTPITQLNFYIQTPITFSTPGVYTEPATAFASVLGSYAPTTDPILNNLYIVTNTGGQVYFDITGVTIASAIPEPSTYAALIGVVALGWGIRRRRRSAGAAQ